MTKGTYTQGIEIPLDKYLEQRAGLNYDPYLQSVFDFLYLTGARISEALAMKKNQIDLQNNIAEIHTLKNRKDKSRRVMLYPQHPTLIQNLQNRLDQIDDKNLIWDITKDYGRQTPRTLIWELCVQTFNTKDHSFRHTHAIQLRRDVHLHEMELKEQMGWTRLESCIPYLKYDYETSIKEKILKAQAKNQ